MKAIHLFLYFLCLTVFHIQYVGIEKAGGISYLSLIKNASEPYTLDYPININNQALLDEEPLDELEHLVVTDAEWYEAGLKNVERPQWSDVFVVDNEMAIQMSKGFFSHFYCDFSNFFLISF